MGTNRASIQEPEAPGTGVYAICRRPNGRRRSPLPQADIPPVDPDDDLFVRP